MKKTLIAFLGFTILATPAVADDPSVLKTQKDKVSYGLGVEAARKFRSQGIEVDPDMLARGLKDGLSGAKLLMPEEDLGKIVNVYQAGLKQERAAQRKLDSEENRKKGEAFLAENGTKEGVVTLPSGLQYRVLKEGAGKVPSDDDAVQVHYRGTHIDGTEFDSSHKSGKPATFKVKGGIIPGWKEALMRMPVGSKWQLFIPPRLAYGERGLGSVIGPNETLVFEVELLSVK